MQSRHLREGKIKSCGCLSNKNLNLIGKRFGRLLVINKALKVNGRTAYLCLCDCGNTKIVTTRELRRGDTKSCGCLIADANSKRSSLNLEGKRFGKLTVIKRVGSKEYSNKKKVSLWLCQCDCGNVITVTSLSLVHGNRISCGCVESCGEEKTGAKLNERQIQYKKEYTFKDLIGPGGGRLRFDFAIFNSDDTLNCLIEFQGPQHDPDKAEYYGDFGKQQREVTDQQKREYCFAHNISLYEIWDISEIDEVLDKISKNLK